VSVYLLVEAVAFASPLPQLLRSRIASYLGHDSMAKGDELRCFR